MSLAAQHVGIEDPLETKTAEDEFAARMLLASPRPNPNRAVVLTHLCP